MRVRGNVAWIVAAIVGVLAGLTVAGVLLKSRQASVKIEAVPKQRTAPKDPARTKATVKKPAARKAVAKKTTAKKSAE